MYKVFQERREDKKRDFCTCNIWMGPSFFVSLDNLPQSEWIGLVFQYLVPCVVLEPHYSIDQIYNGLVGKGNMLTIDPTIFPVTNSTANSAVHYSMAKVHIFCKP